LSTPEPESLLVDAAAEAEALDSTAAPASESRRNATADLLCIGADAGAPLRVPASRVDDDYCDCEDGSDEPTTSACAGFSAPPATGDSGGARKPGTFHCARSGPAAGLPPSRVDDGVCDCCDGGDERRKATRCADSCGALQAAADARRRAREQAAGVKASYLAKVRLGG